MTSYLSTMGVETLNYVLSLYALPATKAGFRDIK